MVKPGVSADDNEIVYQSHEVHGLGEGAIPALGIGKKYNLIDFELGVKSQVLVPSLFRKRSKIAKSFGSIFLDKKYRCWLFEVNPPHVVNEASGYGTGQLPDKEGQMYHVGIDDLYLIPTAEVPVMNIYRDVILEEKDLQLRILLSHNVIEEKRVVMVLMFVV